MELDFDELSIGLAKKFIRIFPQHLTEKPKRTFWPTQYYVKHIEE